jgi:tetratricopeptide (TPR) repeat protein
MFLRFCIAVTLWLACVAPARGADLPANLEAEYEKASALAAAGDLEAARAGFEAAARTDPGDGSLAAATAIFRDLDAGRVLPDAVRRMFRAMQYGNEKKWKEAHEDADQAIGLAPKYARAYATKAALFVEQGEYAQAVAALDRALALDPKLTETYYNRGAIRAELGQIDAAIADYDKAIELQPSYWYAYRNRGSAHTHKNDPEAAVRDYTKALELRPLDVETRMLRAVVVEAIGMWETAIPDLTRVIELDPNHASALYHRGLAYEHRADVARAKADYASAIEKDGAGEVAAAAKQRLAALEARHPD